MLLCILMLVHANFIKDVKTIMLKFVESSRAFRNRFQMSGRIETRKGSCRDLKDVSNIEKRNFKWGKYKIDTIFYFHRSASFVFSFSVWY